MTFGEALVEAIIGAQANGGGVVVMHLGSERPEDHEETRTCQCGPIAFNVTPAVELDDATYESAFRVVPCDEPLAESEIQVK